MKSSRFRMQAWFATAFVVLLVAAAIPSEGMAQLKNPSKLVKGVVSNLKDGQPIGGGKVWAYEMGDDSPVSSSRVNAGDGAYRILLDPDTQYRFRVTIPGYYTADFAVRTLPDVSYDEVKENFAVWPVPIDSLLFSGNGFESGGTAVVAGPELEEVKEFLLLQRAVTVRVAVAPEAGGSDAEVKVQLEDRIKAFKEMLRAWGVSLTRVKWKTMSPDEAGGGNNLVINIAGVDEEEFED